MKTLLFCLLIFFSYSNARSASQDLIDVESKIKELRLATVAERFEYYSKTLNIFKTVPDTESLKNLLEFGLRAYDLSKEIDIDDWMINAAAQIANRATEKLLLLRPVDHRLLVNYYQGFIGDSQASSFSVLTFWMNSVLNGSVNSESELTELISFAESARSISKSRNHEDYVTNLATQIIALASNRILKLNPFIEGIFKLEAKCTIKDAACVPPLTATILVTDDQKGIAVSFSRPEALVPDFIFDAAELSEANILKSSPNSFLSDGNLFKLNFDRANGTFTGLLQSSRLMADIKVKGTKIFGNDLIFKTPPGVFPQIEQIQGLFKGHLVLPSDPKFAITFNIRQLDNHLVASLRGENLFLEFGSGHYIAEKGILTFIANKNGKIIKLTFKVTKNPAGNLKLVGTGIALATAIHWQIELVQ